MVNDAANITGGPNCTLRDAVASVNGNSVTAGCTSSGSGPIDTIEFSLPANTTIPVTGGEIVISRTLTIDASSVNGITLDANSQNRIFNVTGGSRLSITSVTFTNGDVGNLIDGGAILIGPDNLTLTLEQCAFENNQAHNGGALFTLGDATIRNSTFSNNRAQNRGGAVHATGIVAISNSTFSGNEATFGDGGAVYSYWFELKARHLTLLNNTAGNLGQALYAYSSSVTLHNSIIIGNNANDHCINAGGTFSGSHNLEGRVDAFDAWQATTTTCGSSIASPPPISSALSDIIATALADHGGHTPTLALPAGSPAIGAADPTSGGTSQMLDNVGNWVDATLDQRGFGRLPAASGRSIGAYEDGALNATITTNSLPDGTVGDFYTQQMDALPTSGLTFSSATLPAGLTIDNAGEITGVPHTPGTYVVTITVSDADGRKISRAYSLLVHPRAASGGTPIPTLPVPLLLLLAAAAGLLGRRHLRLRA